MNSRQWWEETKSNPEQLTDWLKDQYHGEIVAAERIQGLVSTLPMSETDKATLTVIAAQEKSHAEWVGDLLTNRGFVPAKLVKEERYWNQTLGRSLEDYSLAEISAIGAYAEGMRLERIRVIASDMSAPTDIRNVFGKILKEEEFHEFAFKNMSNSEELNKAFNNHQNGLNALGLTF